MARSLALVLVALVAGAAHALPAPLIAVEHAPSLAFARALDEIDASTPRDALHAARVALAMRPGAQPGALDSITRAERLASSAIDELALAAAAFAPRALDLPDASVEDAARAVAATRGVTLHDDALAALAALPIPERTAVARILVAHVALDAAARERNAEGVIAARHAMLREALALRGTAPADDRCEPVHAPPALHVDLGACDDVHVDDVAVLVDAGGDDLYLNNAGGSNLAGGSCNAPATEGAAVAIDLAGNDRYASGRSCGANGGAAVAGAGFLFDASGNDEYVAGDFGVNGGGSAFAAAAGDSGSDPLRPFAPAPDGGGATVAVITAFGFLVDGGGDDRYVARSSGANGGGDGGSGALIDVAGGDVYNATWFGVNGGGYRGGRGAIVDGAGADRYEARVTRDYPQWGCCGQNGGGYLSGAGFLADLGVADDAYFAGRNGANAGTSLFGTGTLFDEGGNDFYMSRWVGANGGAEGGGTSVLVDAGGDDRYHAGGYAANGGAVTGVALLLDASGNDEYVADPVALGHPFFVDATNGGASTFGFGTLLDFDGNDRYEGASAGGNGGGYSGGAGFLYDQAGDDRYLVVRAGITSCGAARGGCGANGGAFVSAIGALVDLAGNDVYEAGARGVNGGADPGLVCLADSCLDGAASVALLLDGGGEDRYSEDAGACEDCTIAPKGRLGAQVDEP